jgi:hypothetical protein
MRREIQRLTDGAGRAMRQAMSSTDKTLAKLSWSLAGLRDELNNGVMVQTAFVSAQILNHTQALGKSTSHLVIAFISS